jgi:hypothetical protein
MATRSNIWLKLKENQYIGIYVHFDGYPEGVGEILNEHYRDEHKIRELISLGSISYLESKLHPDKKHSFKSPQEGITLAYARDRGEEWIIKVSCNDKPTNLCEEEYAYLWGDGDWYISEDSNDWKLLGEVLKNLED